VSDPKRERSRQVLDAGERPCGHWLNIGDWEYSRNRGMWMCRDCAIKTRMGRTLAQVLAAETRRP